MDKRCVPVNLGGIVYPMCFTLQSYADFLDRYGSMKGCYTRPDELMKTGDEKGAFNEYFWMASNMLENGYWKAIQEGKELAEPPDVEMLKNAFTPGQLWKTVAEALRVGNLQEVGVEAPKNDGGAEAEG